MMDDHQEWKGCGILIILVVVIVIYRFFGQGSKWGAKFVTGNYFTDSGSSDQNLKTLGWAMLFTILVLDERRTRLELE